MTPAIEIIETIQKLPAKDRSMKFLVSLANHAFSKGYLTEKQEIAYAQVLERINFPKN